MNVIVGRKPVIEALNAGLLIERVYLQKGVHGEAIDDIRRLARAKNILCADLDRVGLEKMSRGVNTQGVVAVAGVKEYSGIDDLLAIAAEKKENPLLLIFDEIVDPRNLGALIRTAVCLGFHGGMVPKHHASPVNETVAKASAGASAIFPVAKVTNVVAAMEELKDHGVWIVGTDAASERSFAVVDYTMPVAIVLGNEEKGVRRLVKEKCDFVVSIPMTRAFDSLNVSVAGALLMYEAFRKRNTH